MSHRPRRGRPSKGERRKLRLQYCTANSALLLQLCTRYRRPRNEILTAGVLVGLRYTPMLPTALVSWSSPPAAPAIPAELDNLPPIERPDWVDADPETTAVPVNFSVATVHAKMLDDVVSHFVGISPGTLRSALLWLGLHHTDEFGAALEELDNVQRGAPGQTALAFYAGRLIEGRTVNDMAIAEHRVRRGDTPVDVAESTGVPLELLVALADEARATATEGGQLSLAG